MRLAAALALVLPLAPVVIAPSAAAAVPSPQQQRVIVEFAGAPALDAAAGLGSRNAATRAQASATAKQRTSALRTAHAGFRQQMVNAGIHATVTRDFSQVINAVALTTNASGVGRLRTLPGVTAVYPDATMRTSVDPDVATVRAPEVWQTTDPSGNPDQGTGETVAIIDSGVDYTHPDLGGGFGRGQKVVDGYDFVNNDPDPMDDNGHGTHVAGIIAGDAASGGGRTGVAPKASLTAYKVLAASGYGDESTVIAGLEAAVSLDNPHRADVVNMSLSGPSTPNDPLEQACADAVHAGVVVVAAAGNDGPGESTVGSPAESPDVIAVGASIAGIQVPTVTVVSPVTHKLDVQRLGLSANPPASPEDLDVVDVGNGNPSDYDGKDATGKAVLAAYNGFSVEQVLMTAEQHGAAAILLRTPNFYSTTGNQPGPVLPDIAAGTGDDPDKLDIVATVVNGTDATDLQQWLAEGPVRVRIGSADATDQIAAFSAHGPAPYSYALKPDLVAPGVEIGSTWPGGQYRDDSGTSMAAPHVAGAAALIREAHPDWSATEVAAALTGGSRPLPGYDGVTQGAGRLDVAASDQLTVLPSKRIANLGLADLTVPQVAAATTLTLTNVSSRPQPVNIDGQPAPGADQHVEVTPRSAYLAPGRSVTVRLAVHADHPSTGTDLTGWLRASVPGSPVLDVPYLLAIRPLQVHADPDPTAGGATVFIHAEPDLAAAPRVTVTGPGEHLTTTATFDHTGWWRMSVPAGAPGTYQVSATAPVTSGAVLAGTSAFEELGTSHGDWASVGPDSQGAYEMAATSQPGRMFAMPGTSPHAGLFRTDDSGASWQELRTLPIGDGVDMGLAADSTQPGTVYLAVEGAGNDPTYQGRILASHDAGATWTTLPFPDVAMHDLSIDATGRILTVPAFNGNVYVSVDRGQTWTAYPSPGGFPQQARVIGHDLYIADGASLYAIRDIDGTPQPPRQIFTAPVWYQSIMDVVGDQNLLIADTFQEVFASHDGGATWQPLFTPPDDDPFVSSVQIVNGDVYVASTSEIWVDRGEGTDWATMPAPVDEDFFFVSNWDPSGSQVVVSAEGTGLFVTSDRGASYRRVGLAAASVHALVVDRNASEQEALTAGTTYSTFSTPLPTGRAVYDATRDWGITGEETSIGTRVISLATSPADPHVVYRVVANAFSRTYIQRSDDGGATWDTVENVRTGSRGYQVLVDPADPNVVYAAIDDALSPGVLVSRDGGQTWRKNNVPVSVTALAADPSDRDRIWLGGPYGLFRSDDEGQTVTRLSSLPVSALALDPRNPQHLLAGGDGVYESRDGGQLLRRVTDATLRLNIASLVFGPDGRVFAAAGAFNDAAGLPVGGRGVLASDDSGHSWENVSAGLPNRAVSSLAISPDGQWLYAGTEGGSVYRTSTASAAR